MGSIAQPESIHPIVAAEHEDGVLLHILQLQEVSRRTFTIAVRHNNADPTAPLTFIGFVMSGYRETGFRPNIPLIPDAIAFCAPPEPPHGPTRFNAHTYLSSNDSQYYVLDVRIPDLHLVVPLGVYVPYGRYAAGRTAAVLDSIEPVPLWVVGSNGLGVPVGSGAIQTLEHGDEKFTHADGRRRTTVFVKIEWPGYDIWEAQIRMRNDSSQSEDSYTFKRLVNQVRGKVCKFINDHANVISRAPQWAVGNPHGISADDLTLLAIVVVSQGAIMPILKLRDGYSFAHASPVQAVSNVMAMQPAFSPYNYAAPAVGLPSGYEQDNGNAGAFYYNGHLYDPSQYSLPGQTSDAGHYLDPDQYSTQTNASIDYPFNK